MAHEVLYNALIKRYEAEIADANAKITIMLTDSKIIPEHTDVGHIVMSETKKVFFRKKNNRSNNVQKVK